MDAIKTVQVGMNHLSVDELSLSDLTVAILSFNGAQLTASLVESMQSRPSNNVADVRYLILNNGSSPLEGELLQRLQEARSTSLTLIQSIWNRGVAGGRNLLLDRCETNWIMFLDNDLVADSDILTELARLAPQLAAPFIVLPFRETDSASPVIVPKLYQNKDQSGTNLVGLGTDVENPGYRRVRTVSGVAGGALIAHVPTLRDLGGFRGPGLVGFEDLELSLRIQRSGLEILLAPITPLRHKPTGFTVTSEYTSTRLNPLELRANARFIESHHSVKVWGHNQWSWVLDRQRQQREGLSLVREHLTRRRRRIGDARPRVLVFADRPGWAFDRIARHLRQNLMRDFSVDVTYTQLYPMVQSAMSIGDWDIIHFLWRRPLFTWLRAFGYDSFLEKFSQGSVPRVCYSVYDHQSDEAFEVEIKTLNAVGTRVGFVNRVLLSNYAWVDQFLRNYTPDGVDTRLFRPRPTWKDQSRGITPPHRLTWIGNSAWGGFNDHKGLHSVLLPAVSQLRKLGLVVDFVPLDSQAGVLPISAVARHLRRFELLAVASEHEGTPNPLLEALASGVPAVSTRVGMTSELKDSGAPILFAERSVGGFVAAIREFIELDGDLRAELNKQARQTALLWDWRQVSRNVAEMWQQALSAR